MLIPLAIQQQPDILRVNSSNSETTNYRLSSQNS